MTYPYPAGEYYPYAPSTSAAAGVISDYVFPPAAKERILSFSKLYNKPLKVLVDIYDADLNLLHTYDSFMNKYYDPSININHVEVARTGEPASSFVVRFFDHKNEVDKNKVTTGCWVNIKCAREPLNVKSLVWGRVSIHPFERGRLETSYFELQGEDVLTMIGNTMIRYSKSSELSDILNGTTNPNDENSFAWRIMEDIFTSEDITLTGSRCIRDRARLDMSAFEHEVVDPINTWNVPLSDAIGPVRDLAEICGAYVYVDGDRKLHFTYGHSKHSGVKIKQYIDSEWVAGFDLQERTSYYHGNWSGIKSTVKSSGFANTLITQTGKLRQAISFSEDTEGAFSLYNKDLAQQIKVDNKFVDLVVWLSKVGEGSPSKTKVHGHIVADNNGLPTGAKIATFDIRIVQIPEGTPKAFFVSNLLERSGIVSNNEKVWVCFYEIGDSEERTIKIHHNDKFDGSNSLVSAVRPLPAGRKGDKPDHESTVGWEQINNGDGPVFAFTAYEILDLDFVAVDPVSVAKYGEYEAPYEVPWSNDLLTTIKAMNSVLSESSKPKLEYNMAEVFIPVDYYFDPLDIITIEDTNSGNTRRKSVQSRISQTNMIWDANTITTGIHFCEILPVGFYNPAWDLLGEFNDCEA